MIDLSSALEEPNKIFFPFDVYRLGYSKWNRSSFAMQAIWLYLGNRFLFTFHACLNLPTPLLCTKQ